MSKLLQNMPLPSIPQTLPPLPQSLPPLPTTLPPFNHNYPSSQQKLPYNTSNDSMDMPLVRTTIVLDTRFGRYPIVLNCPYCNEVTQTKVKKVHPCLDFFCCFCCCCGLRCKKRFHSCSKCNKYLGMCDL